MSTDKEKLDKIRDIVTNEYTPQAARRRIREVLDEDVLIFPTDREIAVTVETSDPVTRIIQSFRFANAFVTESTVQGKASIVIEGDVSYVVKRTDGV